MARQSRLAAKMLSKSSAPLNYADFGIIIATNDFDSIFAANRLCLAIAQKSQRHKVKMAGVIANRVDYVNGGGTSLLEQFVETVGTKIIGKVPYHDLIRRSRLAGKTMFEMEGPDKEKCLQPFLDMAELILGDPESSIPTPLNDREIFDVSGGWK